MRRSGQLLVLAIDDDSSNRVTEENRVVGTTGCIRLAEQAARDRRWSSPEPTPAGSTDVPAG